MKRKYAHNLRVLVYADLHVGDRSNGRTYQDAIEAERFITQLAIEKKVDWVIFAGDAFKSRNPHDEHKTRWLDARLERENAFLKLGIRQLDVVGNHCRWYKADNSGHVFEALKLQLSSLHVVADQQCTIWSDERVTFHVLPAQVDFKEENWDFSDPQSVLQICVFHGMVKGCPLNQSGTVKANEGLPIEVLDRPEFDWVALGDIHLPSQLDFQHTRGGYVGSTLQLDATDVGEKRGCMVITFEKEASEPFIEFVSVPQAELKLLIWDAKESLPDLRSYAGHLLTLRVVNASALSSVDLDVCLDKVRKVVRHLVVVNEVSNIGIAQQDGDVVRTFDDPVEDFGSYLDKLPSLDESRKTRVLDLLRKEVFNA